MKIFINPSRTTWPQLTTRPQLELEFLESSVRNIFNRVKKSGDNALRELTLQFDKVNVGNLAVIKRRISKRGKVAFAHPKGCHQYSSRKH